ncbi:Hypothetical protein CGLY_11770 [Corynebacterium glyciniphilum AJ 3170]|uniref:Uncharacterized protein n=1 Tax=Corynebacterium glyciniphilum AJ 3170 TaxID=1404245 RepID=X5DU69_9CORY|nr:hypothetical protein [Corynebacterium glyciniphilum]AHW64799.1 Hypothetical protein CGLY_11770 [Corynebacterium glyciniphilum AJ 3170]
MSLVNTADDALEMATILMEAGAAGAGGGSTSGCDSFWESVSTGPLAALIMAASIRSEGIQWVRDAVSLVSPRSSTPTTRTPASSSGRAGRVLLSRSRTTRR